MFHVRDGLYFERINSEPGYGVACVRILKRQDGSPESPIVFDMIVDSSTWASIVTSVSAAGETGLTYALACVFQRGGHIDDSATCREPKQR